MAGHGCRSATSRPFQPRARWSRQLQELARKLLDLWQDHLSALAQDPNLMAQALKLMAAYAPFPWPPGMSPTGGPGFAPSAVPSGPIPRPIRPGFATRLPPPPISSRRTGWARARCRST